MKFDMPFNKETKHAHFYFLQILKSVSFNSRRTITFTFSLIALAKVLNSPYGLISITAVLI